MKRKSILIIAILLMSIGFAAVSTTLIINGNAKVSENNEDFSVIFTAASIDGNDVYSTAVDDTKKIITFTTSELKTLNQTSILTYEVTNNSSQYDAEVSVTCVPKAGTTAKYTSIKNKLGNDATVVKAKTSVNGTLTVTLNKTATESVTEEYTCKLEFNAVERTEIAVEKTNLYNLIKNNADTKTVIDYKVRSGASGTNGIYTTTATVGNVPVYYYRGAADKVNNNLVFNNMCWKIIRTTKTGGIKIIYNGVPADGKCETQTGEATQIGTSAFNTSYNDNAYVGYMYGTAGSSTYQATNANTNESTIKKYIDSWYKANFDETATSKLEDTVFCNDRTTKAYDANTIGDTSYSSYGNLGYGTNPTFYGAAHRTSYFSNNPSPSLVCQNDNDKFTIDNQNGNGKLTYPVGLITLDEVVLAGFNTYNSNKSDYKDTTNYLYTNTNYWALSPVMMRDTGYSSVGYVYSAGFVDYAYVNSINCVRPVVSLISGTLVNSNGDGTSANPYVVI
mgnify:FL=1